MARIKDIDYAYAVAKIRAMETHLLDKQKFSRMIDATSMDEAAKILRESGYEGDSADEMISSMMDKTYAFLKDLSPYPDAFNIFLIKNDYHNIKVILKSEFIGENFDRLLKDNGRFEKNDLKRRITDRRFDGFSKEMSEAVRSAINIFDKTKDPQLCDMIIDKAAFDEMTALSAEIKNKYISNIVKTMIDLTNIKTFVRVSKMKKNADFLIKALIDGGEISTKTFVQHFGRDLPEILSKTVYETLSEYSGSITELEKAVDNFLTESVKKAKYVSFGIEPLIAYLFAKETETKIVRIIMTAKKNNISPDIIKERLRESYV